MCVPERLQIIVNSGRRRGLKLQTAPFDRDTSQSRPLKSHVAQFPADSSEGAFTPAFAAHRYPRMCPHPRPRSASLRPAHGHRRDARRPHAGACGVRGARSETTGGALSTLVVARARCHIPARPGAFHVHCRRRATPSVRRESTDRCGLLDRRVVRAAADGARVCSGRAAASAAGAPPAKSLAAALAHRSRESLGDRRSRSVP
jgi:hypothetical protein